MLFARRVWHVPRPLPAAAVPVSEVAQLESTKQACKTYEAHKAEQLPLLTPVTKEPTP